MMQTPVAISGGGPVGLVLALSLSRLGVRSILINDRLETTTHPKLDVVNTRSMEIFRQLGLATRIRDAGNPTSANQYVSFAAAAVGPFYKVLDSRHFIYKPNDEARQQIRETNDGTLPLESMQRIAQMYLEPVLLAQANADPNIEVRFGWRTESFEQDADGVTVQITHLATGEGQQVASRFLVGCDGPASRVRKALDIDYDATRDILSELFIVHFRSDAIAALYPNSQPYWHTWLSRPQFTGLLVSPDAGRRDFILHRPFKPREGESLRAVIESAIGADVEFEIVQSGPWRPQFLVATSFGRGRVFIAGDATHQYMPTGGLGMNTGVTEAHNLAWKLAAVLNGWGGPKLLDSYEAERLPVARSNRDHVKKCAAAVFEVWFEKRDHMTETSVEGEQDRAELGALFEQKITRLYESLGTEIGYRYRHSPVIWREEQDEPPFDDVTYRPTTFSGSRLPSTFLREGTAIFDLLEYGKFTLLYFGSRAGQDEAAPLLEAFTARGVPLKLVLVDEPLLASVYQRRFVLVRPDQHVCWRGDQIPEDCLRLVETVRGAA